MNKGTKHLAETTYLGYKIFCLVRFLIQVVSFVKKGMFLPGF